MNDNYSTISSFYDKINSSIDYEKWADFVEKCFSKYLSKKPELLLDLACGTGSMTFALAKRGYDMIGIDQSTDMLSCAFERKYEENLPNVLFLNQDMTSFELYGTVGAITCTLDSINYLTEDGELDKCFSLAHNYLDKDGLFIFDVNSEEKFNVVYADNSYVYEEDECGNGKFCVWQNYYDKETKICDFDLTVFSKNNDGTYQREDERQSERCFSVSEIENALKKNGFEVLDVVSDFDFNKTKKEDLRLYFIAKCKKD